MVRKEIFGITIGMAGYPIGGKPKGEGKEIEHGKHPYGLYIAVMAIAIAAIIAAIFMAGTPVQAPDPPMTKQADQSNTGTATSSRQQAGQETTSTAGISVHVAKYDFYEAKEWTLNTLYINQKNPGSGVFLVRTKDIEYLQPFRIANAEYSNFRFEKHEKDISGFIARLRADAVITPQGNVEARLFIKVWDKLPQKDQTGIMNGAIILFTSGMDFEKLPPNNSVLEIGVTQ